ncbi:MAG: lipopolysaccharide transport periplasmic protein LptA [Geobacter sp.]|nr:lipopolysaccharide transport periplasmic protein LptA [Geobacter sp.]
MSRIIAILIISFSLATSAIGAGKPLPARSEEPIKIKSDSLSADNTKKTATFIGNVAARQGDLTIYSDKLIVTYSDESGDVSSAELFGNVRIIQGERRGEAGHAVYDAKQATILLDGNPTVYQNNDKISGKVITYYLDQDRSEVTSGAGNRVEAVINPKGKVSDGQKQGK